MPAPSGNTLTALPGNNALSLFAYPLVKGHLKLTIKVSKGTFNETHYGEAHLSLNYAANIGSRERGQESIHLGKNLLEKEE